MGCYYQQQYGTAMRFGAVEKGPSGSFADAPPLKVDAYRGFYASNILPNAAYGAATLGGYWLTGFVNVASTVPDFPLCRTPDRQSCQFGSTRGQTARQLIDACADEKSGASCDFSVEACRELAKVFGVP